MEFRGIQLERLLAVFLGASAYEESPNLADGSAFYNSANDLRNYLRNGLGVSRKNIKWLFDDSHSPSDQLTEVARFLSERCAALKADGTPAQDLLIYYVGHGLFAREQYCLAIRATKEHNEAFSSIRGADLAGVVKEYARFLRRFLIFDCCFSAAIYKEFQFQSPPVTIARSQIIRELPARGTSLLCSSNADDPSFVSSRLGRTMFSDALMKSLTEGDASLGNPMSFSELGDLVRENLKTKYDGSWARPEVHSPDQREGDIAQLPIFPNAAYSSPDVPLELENKAIEQAQQERLAQEEKQRAEQERLKQEKQAQEQADQERLELEKLARDRAEQERLELERAKLARLKQLKQKWAGQKPDQEKQVKPESEVNRRTNLGDAEHKQNLQMLDEAWEAEKVKRQNELSRVLVEGLSGKKPVADSPVITQLRASLTEWLEKRPPGFEYRQIQRREKQEAETNRAYQLWLQAKRKR